MRTALGSLTLLMLLTTTACTKVSEYTPVEESSGKEIFQGACAECHDKNDRGYYFELDKDMASVEAISDKIHEGGLLMPAFPKIIDDPLSRVAQYVLDNSAKP